MAQNLLHLQAEGLGRLLHLQAEGAGQYWLKGMQKPRFAFDWKSETETLGFLNMSNGHNKDRVWSMKIQRKKEFGLVKEVMRIFQIMWIDKTLERHIISENNSNHK